MDVAPANVVQALIRPVRKGVDAQNTLDVAPRADVRFDLLIDEAEKRSPEGILMPLNVSCDALLAQVSAFTSSAEDYLGAISGGLQIQRRRCSEGNAMLPASQKSPRGRHASLARDLVDHAE
ncbi:hypothetical protein J2R91_000994 [Bradyrhizobium japonicum]|nr:hypothetical protein [Bradyrhizobium japonicum]MCP1774482.1 hypothetical protein [Bradyrhizobium japonicum]MCP1962516.1 hypothetical protein [Bradyrhizobium japonicum]